MKNLLWYKLKAAGSAIYLRYLLVNEDFSFEFIVTLNQRESYIEGLSICFPFTFKDVPHLCTDGNI